MLRAASCGHGAVQLVSLRALSRAFEIGQPKGSSALVSQDVRVIFKHGEVFGEGARLVDAHDIHGSQGLHGIDVFNDDLPVFEASSTSRKANAGDHRQHFRHQANGGSKREEQGLRPVSKHRAADEHHKGKHDEHAFDEAEADVSRADAVFGMRAVIEAHPRRLVIDFRKHGCRCLTVGDGGPCQDDVAFLLYGEAAFARKGGFGHKDMLACV